MAGMSDEHRKILQKHRMDFIEDLEPLKLLNDLVEYLDEEDREIIKSHNTRKARVEELVGMMPRRGPKAFQSFVAALHKRQPHLAKPLIQESGIDCSTFQKDPSEEKRVEFFGDLDENQASEIVSRLQEEPSLSKLLHTELTKDLGIDHNLSTQELMRQSTNYRIRKFFDSLTSEVTRATLIKIFRGALPTHKGVTGPLLPPKTCMREVGYIIRRDLTKELCGDDSWKVLAQKLGMDNTSIRYFQVRKENPADEVLRSWEVKSGGTVGALYDILVELGYPYIADRL